MQFQLQQNLQRYPRSHFHEVSWAVGPLGQSGVTWRKEAGSQGEAERPVTLDRVLAFCAIYPLQVRSGISISVFPWSAHIFLSAAPAALFVGPRMPQAAKTPNVEAQRPAMRKLKFLLGE